jgi:hypothetical protein
MSGEEKTVVFDGSLGTAVWEYIPENKKAWGYFSASGVTENNTTPFDIVYQHVFFSNTLSLEENEKIFNDLAQILISVGAVEVTANVQSLTPIAQQINVYYIIPKVEQDKVNALSTAIASVSKDLINKLAGYPVLVKALRAARFSAGVDDYLGFVDAVEAAREEGLYRARMYVENGGGPVSYRVYI